MCTDRWWDAQLVLVSVELLQSFTEDKPMLQLQALR